MQLVSLCCIFVLKHKCDNKGYKISMSCLIVFIYNASYIIHRGFWILLLL